MRFEGGFTASNCNAKGGANAPAGNGGGIFNGETGNIVFKGAELFMSDCGYNASFG